MLKVYAPLRQFVLPYIKRRLPDLEIVGVDNPDLCDVAILSPGDPVPQRASTVLLCPNIVGTGMTGLPMYLARKIVSGSYFHLPGNEARLSTIHASDVAEAVALSIGVEGVFTVTDGDNPTFRDFAEALAWRLNHKRILSLSSKWVRWIISPSLKRIITTDATVDSSEFTRRFDFHPTPVTQYLQNHVYDENSL